MSVSEVVGMEIRDVRYFLELAESGNYLKAALNLGISQSMLSKRIMALEAELGATLVDRSRRAIKITEAGLVVKAQSRRILLAHRDMLKELAVIGSPHTATVTILSIPVLAAYDIPSLLDTFRKAVPGIELRVLETEAKDIIPALLSGEAELGIMRGAFVDTNRFEYVTQYDDEAVAVLPRKHPLGSAEVLDLWQLKGERFILMDKQTLQLDFFINLCMQSGFQPNIVHTSTHADNVLNMVASGFGVSLLPRRVAEFPEAVGVSIVPLWDQVPLDLGLIWQKSSPTPLSLQYLIEKTNRFKSI